MLAPRLDRVRRILCLGAHSDDIEIGCGGTLLKLLAESPGKIDIRWVVFCAADAARAAEARRSAAAFTRGAARATIQVESFPDGYLPWTGPAVKDAFESLKPSFAPDLIFTHHRNDLHQDHRTLCELTWNTFRDHLILEYEVPKYDADLGAPNCFVPLSKALCRRKVAGLMRHFATQRSRSWFTEDLFMALLRIRGTECRSQTGFAEGFYGRKITLA